MAEIKTKREARKQAVLSLKKKASEDERVSRVPLGPVGYNSLKTVSGWIFEEAKRELRWPTAGKTYKEMAYDSTVASVISAITILIANVEMKFEAPKDSSAESQAAADFLNWCMHNMEDMTWEDFIGEALSYLQYGFHMAEKVYTQVKSGKWEGKYKWKHLPTRSAESLTQWEFDKDGIFTAVEQNPNLIGKSVDTRGLVKIPRKKLVHFRYRPVNNNPQGTSPLKGCYQAWKYKSLIEEYEAVGVAKDLGGIPVIGVDVDYLAKAQANPTGPEAAVIDRMRKDAANLHAGEQQYVMTPLAYNEQGKEMFKFDLKGVDGGGKQYNTDDIIKRKQNEILTVFLADVLKLGQDGVGSYALSDSKNNLLALAIKAHIKLLASAINRDLAPQTLAINGYFLSEDEMPRLVFGDIEDRDLDILSKFIQRSVSVGAVSVDKELDNALREFAGLPSTDYEKDDVIPQEFISGSGSKSGKGMKTAGEGTSNGTSDDASVGNTENT